MPVMFNTRMFRPRLKPETPLEWPWPVTVEVKENRLSMDDDLMTMFPSIDVKTERDNTLHTIRDRICSAANVIMERCSKTYERDQALGKLVEAMAWSERARQKHQED